MNINLDLNAQTPYGMFNLDEQQSDELLNHIAAVCERALKKFPKEYAVLGVVQESDSHTGELMHRLDNGRIINEMLEIAQNENEKNYILYLAFTGISRVSYLLFGEQV